MYKLPADIDLEKLAPYFERDYFAWGGKGQPIGYAGLYTDFPDNLRLVKMILDRKPKSVLDLGCARGFIVKRLNDIGIPSWGIDISRYCWKTRVTENIVTGSITDMHMFEDKQFDLGVSIETFEHIPEKYVDQALKEVARVCNRAFISLSYEESVLPNDIDITHVNLKPARWWEDKFAPYGFELNYRKEEPKLIPYANPGPDAKVGLNIGSFVSMFLDTEQTKWYNIDKLDLRSYAETYRYNFIQHDVTQGLPFPDGSVQYIFASHILEHFTREELNLFLREVLRVMEQGGLARFATPDLQVLSAKYIKEEMGEFDDLNPEYEAAPTQAEKYWRIVIGGHKSIFDYESLRRTLSDVGFTSINKMPPFVSSDKTMQVETFDQYPTLSLYVEATKPEPLYKKYLEGEIEEGMQ
jgi:predicted SAM-dependent methyltransferase